MKIKKFQKIICLGLALLSIMVLPCYADVYDDIIIFNTSNNGELWMKSELPYNATFKSGNYVPIINYSNPSSATNEYNYMIYCSNKNTKYIYVATLYNLLAYDNVDQLLYIQKIANDNIIININNDSIETPINIYKITFKNYNEPILSFYDYGMIFHNYESSYITDIIGLLLITPTYEAVLNITTYTNLLIQNFGKAFTFMTGQALPWVLLGISVSLISFGIYYAKRFL